MKRRVMRQEDVAEFCRYLQGEERSQGTIETYRREIRAFAATLPENRVVTKEVVVAWKETLAKRYAVSTVNGKLAALNGLFSFLGWRECRVKPLRRQRELFRDKGRELDKGEYLRLLAAAKRRENWRLYYLMETLASTGMRVSELRFVTVQALAAGTAGRTKQDESAVTFAPMLSRELSPMDFTRPARSLHDQVRGLQPWPCAVTELSGATVKVYRTAVGGAVKAAPGTIVRADKTGIEIACGDGLTLRILELQPQNGKRMAVASYLAGHPVQVTV